ncbi:hypothetical protein Tco_1335288 [Tanacetum coccineum]
MVSLILGKCAQKLFRAELLFHESKLVCPRHKLPLFAILRSHSWQLRENLAIRRSKALCLRCLHEECQFLLPGPLVWSSYLLGLSSDVSDAGLPSEKITASGKNGDDGDLLLFRDGPGACDISAGTLRLFISWECSRLGAGVKVSSILGLDDMSRSVGFWHCAVGFWSIGAYP